MARTPQRCPNPSLSNSNKATKAIGGIREEESKGEHQIPQDLDLGFPHKRGRFDRCKYGSRSTLSFSQI
jgi:hypothetical protein